MQQRLPLHIRLLAIAAVLLLFTLIWLYTQEFRVFTNSIGVRNLVLGAFLVGALVAATILYALRKHLTPWENHLPETFFIAVFCVLFAPLFASLTNRAGGSIENQSFVFVSEMPYLATSYGILRGQPLKATGIRLTVKKDDRTYRFQYKSQEYFPLSKPGDRVLLPVRKGLLGVGVVELK